MWHVYVLESLKNKRLYIGYTNNLRRRLEEHNKGIGGEYTKNNKPFKLIFCESFLEKRTHLLKKNFTNQATEEKF